MADFIFIATKSDALDNVIQNLDNFVKEDTVILSLLNGINSEKVIAEKFGTDKVLYSYYIGHSAERVGRKILHDGVNKIVFGSILENDKNLKKVKDFFELADINYGIPNDIIHSLWAKFMVNVSLNQTTALYKLNVGQMLESSEAFEFFTNLMEEVEQIAVAENINNPYNLRNEVLEFVNSMPYGSKTSMLQDVLAGRKLELDLFAKTIVNLGNKHNIKTPYNQKILDKLI